MISVKQLSEDPLAFEVVVDENGSETRHHVSMSREHFVRLSGGDTTPDQVVEAVFWFLLDREPKEAILERFDVSVISRYFPEFERELPRYLAKESGG